MRYTTVLACAVVTAVALAGEPAAAQIGHQGQHISDHVVLRDGGLAASRVDPPCAFSASFKDKALFQVLPDGTRASEPYTVPAGRLLVITDVEWTVDALVTGLPLTPGATVRTRLQIGSGSNFTSVFLSRTIEVGSERGNVSGSEQLATGFVVGANTVMCPGAAEIGANTSRSARLLELVLRGYVIAAH